MTEETPLLTARQVANWLNLSVAWLDQCRSKNGDKSLVPPHLRFGKRVRYRRQDVRDWLKTREEKQTGKVQRTKPPRGTVS